MILDIKRSFIAASFLSALAIAALTAPASASMAGMGATASSTPPQLIHQVYRGQDRADFRQDLRYDRRTHGERYRGRRDGYSHYHGGYYYATPWWLGGGVVVRENDYRRPDRGDRRRNMDRHVQWCSKHHATYDWRSNTYVGRDGRPRECVVR
jgi:hypothetical protein